MDDRVVSLPSGVQDLCVCRCLMEGYDRAAAAYALSEKLIEQLDPHSSHPPAAEQLAKIRDDLPGVISACEVTSSAAAEAAKWLAGCQILRSNPRADDLRGRVLRLASEIDSARTRFTFRPLGGDWAELRTELDVIIGRACFDPDGPCGANRFRFAGEVVDFGKAALQQQLMLALWDEKNGRFYVARPVNAVMDAVYGHDHETDEAAFRQLCADTNRRIERYHVPLRIRNEGGQVLIGILPA
jgi:hypothetical protein